MGYWIIYNSFSSWMVSYISDLEMFFKRNLGVWFGLTQASDSRVHYTMKDLSSRVENVSKTSG